jgi:predicted ATPase
MADKLIVRDFGPIRNAELDIKKTTVLIGPQGSGKSTLAKLVAFAADNGWRFALLSNTGLSNFLSDYQLQGYITGTSFFKIFGKELVIVCENLSFSGNFKEDFSGKSEILNIKKQQSRGEITFFEMESMIREKLSRPIYVPAERTLYSTVSEIIFSLAANKIPLPQAILDFGNKFENARRAITEFQTIITDIKYSFSNGKDMIISKDVIIPLSASASGYQALVPMQLVVEYLSKESALEFVVEEPELNLYPTTQKKLIYYLVDKCTKLDNQLLLTTHSPYVLSSLNNLLFAYKVAQKHPEQAEEISKIIPKESWLNPEDFAAYFVADGTVKSITSPITGLIAENELDGVSEDITDEFNALMEIYRTQNETSH